MAEQLISSSAADLHMSMGMGTGYGSNNAWDMGSMHGLDFGDGLGDGQTGSGYGYGFGGAESDFLPFLDFEAMGECFFPPPSKLNMG
jgi:hypothetical protein